MELLHTPPINSVLITKRTVSYFLLFIISRVPSFVPFCLEFMVLRLNTFIGGLKIYEHREVPMDLCSWNNQGDHSRADFPLLGTLSNGTGVNGEIERLLAEFPQSVQLERTSIVLHEMIGTGQFGVVYRAEIDDGMGKIKQVAIKANKNETNLDDNNKVSFSSNSGCHR